MCVSVQASPYLPLSSSNVPTRLMLCHTPSSNTCTYVSERNHKRKCMNQGCDHRRREGCGVSVVMLYELPHLIQQRLHTQIRQQ